MSIPTELLIMIFQHSNCILLLYKNVEFLYSKIISNTTINISLEKYINLKYLSLSNNRNITDNGLQYLKNIQHLDLHCNENITDNGLQHLKNLQYLDLANNKNITDTGLSYLQNIKTLNDPENRFELY